MNWPYIFKVASGAILVIGAAVFSLAGQWLEMELSLRAGLLGMGALVCATLAAAAPLLYRRCDELHRAVHQLACVHTLPLLVMAFSLMGALQAADVMPTFNQYGSMLILIAIWAVQLMLSDRRTR
ncbi:MAG: hypothetical protein K9J82_10250 [Methylotenera sp.]|nr:hypothetical protein [Methylotenera sp.]